MIKTKDQPFEFKQFKIAQDACMMKVGTDGILLGASVEVKDASNILDIGCGSGLIGIMLAQRTENCAIHAGQEICRFLLGVNDWRLFAVLSKIMLW